MASTALRFLAVSGSALHGFGVRWDRMAALVQRSAPHGSSPRARKGHLGERNTSVSSFDNVKE